MVYWTLRHWVTLTLFRFSQAPLCSTPWNNDETIPLENADSPELHLDKEVTNFQELDHNLEKAIKLTKNVVVHPNKPFFLQPDTEVISFFNQNFRPLKVRRRLGAIEMLVVDSAEYSPMDDVSNLYRIEISTDEPSTAQPFTFSGVTREVYYELIESGYYKFPPGPKRMHHLKKEDLMLLRSHIYTTAGAKRDMYFRDTLDIFTAKIGFHDATQEPSPALWRSARELVDPNFPGLSRIVTISEFKKYLTVDEFRETRNVFKDAVHEKTWLESSVVKEARAKVEKKNSIGMPVFYDGALTDNRFSADFAHAFGRHGPFRERKTARFYINDLMTSVESDLEANARANFEAMAVQWGNWGKSRERGDSSSELGSEHWVETPVLDGESEKANTINKLLAGATALPPRPLKRRGSWHSFKKVSEAGLASAIANTRVGNKILRKSERRRSLMARQGEHLLQVAIAGYEELARLHASGIIMGHITKDSVLIRYVTEEERYVVMFRDFRAARRTGDLPQYVEYINRGNMHNIPWTREKDVFDWANVIRYLQGTSNPRQIRDVLVQTDAYFMSNVAPMFLNDWEKAQNGHSDATQLNDWEKGQNGHGDAIQLLFAELLDVRDSYDAGSAAATLRQALNEYRDSHSEEDHLLPLRHSEKKKSPEKQEKSEYLNVLVEFAFYMAIEGRATFEERVVLEELLLNAIKHKG